MARLRLDLPGQLLFGVAPFFAEQVNETYDNIINFEVCMSVLSRSSSGLAGVLASQVC